MGNAGSRETKRKLKKTILRGCAAARMAAQPKNCESDQLQLSIS